MKILNRLARKNLKLNKKRTIVTIIGIILATMLITGTSTVASSLQASRIEHQKKIEGDYHYEFAEVSKSDIDNIINNENIESLFVTKKIGATEIENLEGNKVNIEIDELSSNAYDSLGIEITDGRLPENDSEIVISNNINRYADINLSIGNDINLEITDENNNKQIKEYSIVGKVEITSTSIEMPGIYENSTYSILSYLEDQNDYTNKYNIYVRFKNLDNRLNTIGEILELNDKYIENLKAMNNIVKAEEKLLDDDNIKYDIKINNILMQLEGGGYRDSTEDMIYYIAFIIILVILVISVYCIKNSFNISMTERIREYGMIASIGATKKQLKKEILYEAYLMGKVAIPIGLILGVGSVYLILEIIQNVFSEKLFGMEFTFSVSIVSIIMAVLLSMVTIYLSAIGAARKASKITPIDAIRESKDIHINRKKIKSSKIIKRLFGIGGDIAYKNLKRNKRKYKTTVISIVLSVSLFIGIISFESYANEVNKILFGDINYNIQIYSDDITKLKEIANDPKIEKYSLLAIKDADIINYEEHTTQNAKMEGTSYPAPEFINIVSLGVQEYDRYIQKLGLKYEDVKDKAILYDYKTRTIDVDGKDKYLLYRIYDFKDGDTIKYSITTKEENTMNFEIKIAKVASEEPMYLTNSNMAYLIVSDEFWNSVPESFFGINCTLSIATDNAEEMNQYIENKYNGYYDTIINIDESEKEQKAQIITITIFIYMFIGVIILIGITNIFNTIATNMKLRQKEFAILKSVGMTNKEFNRMIRLETIFYCTKSLIIGIPLGLIFSYAIYRAFLINFMGIKFIWPVLGILISIIAVLILIGTIMKCSLNKINKQNIIETIRKDNI